MNYQLRRLETGHWHARKNPQLWAQWPIGREPTRDDVFDPHWGAEEFFEWWREEGRKLVARIES